ncbi:MAG: ABC transporter substrate-binding protein [Deltaproteobacteria bacterium]|nr:ABC transporter substrate-binding protein [Deltaproteobacteria bacterium]
MALDTTKLATTFLLCLSLVACRERQTTTPSPDAATGATSNAAADATDILIGEYGSLTGSEATFGTSTRDGIELAIRQANQAGGVKGKKLRVKVYDDQGKPEEAASVVTKLITQDKVVALLGEVASSRTIAAAPIAQNNRVPMITPSSTNPRITDIGDHIFRVCFIDPFQGTVMAKFAKDTLKAKSAAILRDTKSDYSMGLADYFIEAFKAGGGTIVKDEAYTSGDVHFKSQLTAIKGSKPDIVFIPGYYTEAGLIARQARELGVSVPLLGGDGWDSPKLTEIGGKFVENTYFSNHYSDELDTPEVKRFVADFETAFKYKPDGLSAMGYDAANVLIDAMKRAPDATSKALRDAIAATKDFPGVTGKITIDSKRNATKSAVVLKVADGRYRYVTTINP